MDFIASKSDINDGIGHLDVHRVRGKIKELPKQFTLEFWMKLLISNSNIENYNNIELFGLYLYNDEDPTSIYDAGFVDGHEAFIDNDYDIHSYISIFLQDGNIIFNINNLKNIIIKDSLVTMWNHIALVLDANTSCTWYLNGRPIVSYNCLNESFKKLLNKKFCRFLWSLYSKNDIQSYIYNINLNENTTNDISQYKGIRYNNTFTPPIRKVLPGTYYTMDPFNNTAIRNDETYIQYTGNIYSGPPLNDDGYLNYPILITPQLAHNSCNLNCLIYLPMQNYTDKDYGSLNLQWQGEQGYYGEAIHPYSSYYPTYPLISSTQKEYHKIQEEFKYPDSVIFNTSHENLFYTFTPYNLYGPFIDKTNTHHCYNLFSNIMIKTDDLQYLNETGFTFDWFSISYNLNYNNAYALNSPIGNYADPLYFFNNLFIPCTNILNLPNHDVRKYTNTWKIYTNKEKTEILSGTFTTVIDLLRLYSNEEKYQNNYEVNNNYLNSKNIFSCIKEKYKYYNSAANNNFDHIWKFGIDYGIHHYAIVFKPGYKIRLFFDGQLYETDTEFHGIVPGEYYLPYFNKHLNFSHFRMTPGCLWYDNTFDTTTDTRLFVQKSDPSQKISDIEENNIALLYPIKNPETNYDRRYSINVNADKTSDMQKANFQVSYDSISQDKMQYNYEITGIGTHKPIKYESYPAILSNNNDNNTLIFMNHHLEDVPWTVEFWIYLQQFKQITLSTIFNIFYLSGYGLDTLNNSATNKIGGFIGLKTSYKGDICVITNRSRQKSDNRNIIYNSGRYFDGFKYILDDEELKINLNWIDSKVCKFNINDWNHIAFSTDYITNTNTYRTTCLYINGQYITNTEYPIINLHKLFFYLGNKYLPLIVYFTGIQVTMGVSKYFNGNLNESKSIYNWEDC